MRTRTFVIAGLLAAFLVAGVGSYYASSHPDGLEHVAEQAGFADRAKDSATADSPLSDYRVKGVENDRVSGGLAGVVGALVVLVLAGGLAYAVRRKGSAGQGGPEPGDPDRPDLRDPEDSSVRHQGSRPEPEDSSVRHQGSRPELEDSSVRHPGSRPDPEDSPVRRGDRA